MRKTLNIIIPIVAVALSCLFAFTSIDNLILDLFQKEKGGIDENNILLVDVDDDSIDNAGALPWNRDIYGEMILVLRELGAKGITFDIGFENPSPFNPLFDNDDFFQNAIKACTNVSLPLKMVKGREVKNADLDYVESHFALENVEAINDSVTVEYDSIKPCLDILTKAADECGFSDQTVDSDGRVRRVQLLAKYKGKYYPHLMFVNLLREYGKRNIKVYNHKIVIEGIADEEGNSKDIVFPRDASGAVVLDFPKDAASLFDKISAWDVYHFRILENELMNLVASMEDWGFFNYTPDIHSPFYLAEKSIERKEQLFAELEAPVENRNEYFNLYSEEKEKLYDAVKMYVDGAAQEILIELSDESPATIDFINTKMEQLRTLYNEAVELRRTIREKANGSECIIGVSSPSYANFFDTPYDKGVSSSVINSVIACRLCRSDEILFCLPWWVSAIFAMILCGLLSLIFYVADSKGKNVVFGLVCLVMSVALPFALFKFGIYAGAIVPFAAVVFCYAGYFVCKGICKLTARLSAASENMIKAEPEKLNASVLVSGIKDFSELCDSIGDPGKLVSIVNAYFEKMIPAIKDNGGTVGRCDSGSIMAFFGAPEKYEGHADRSCFAALQMKKLELQLNKKLEELYGCPKAIDTCIGISTGEVIAGNTGIPGNMNYSLMGKTVTAAVQLEKISERSEINGIIISDSTQEKIGSNFEIHALEGITASGSRKKLKIFQLIHKSEETGDKA